MKTLARDKEDGEGRKTPFTKVIQEKRNNSPGGDLPGAGTYQIASIRLRRQPVAVVVGPSEELSYRDRHLNSPAREIAQVLFDIVPGRHVFQAFLCVESIPTCCPRQALVALLEI
jgi:hypothetical protein